MFAKLMKKSDFKVILIVVLSLVSGSLATSAYLVRAEKEEINTAQKNETYQNLLDNLIEIKSYTGSGVNQTQWPEMMRKLSVSISKYKINNNPDALEIEYLDEILSEMRKTLEAWKINFDDYSCYKDKPSKKCIEDYASQVFEVNQVTEKDKEEFVRDFTAGYDNTRNLVDMKNELISWRLTFVTFSIINFFKFHDINA